VYFEFDTRKSDSNKAKHGIDFVEAQALWKSKHVLLGAKDALEKRYMIIGRIGTQHWSAIITYRGGIIRIMIISVRKSTATETRRFSRRRLDFLRGLQLSRHCLDNPRIGHVEGAYVEKNNGPPDNGGKRSEQGPT